MLVEVDQETAQVEIKRYGRRARLRPRDQSDVVEGQIHGGVAHGIGNAFTSSSCTTRRGQLLNASFMDYLLPTATDVRP